DMRDPVWQCLILVSAVFHHDGWKHVWNGCLHRAFFDEVAAGSAQKMRQHNKSMACAVQVRGRTLGLRARRGVSLLHPN
ncbi:MAG TPA: hypothetical protein P5114_14305, partial [Hyphomicrobiaceae bacterium]|nr:hypothetical protein [Hyphomicrobiaceae bacterium]